MSRPASHGHGDAYDGSSATVSLALRRPSGPAGRCIYGARTCRADGRVADQRLCKQYAHDAARAWSTDRPTPRPWRARTCTTDTSRKRLKACRDDIFLQADSVIHRLCYF
jgi:hypothetical protein